MKHLEDYIAAHRYADFKWLEHDCISFGGDWVMVCRGKDPIPEYRGYGSPMEAFRALRAIGGFRGLGNKRFGAEVRPAFMQRGDVALVQSGRKIGLVSGYTFGVCTGTHIAVPTAKGVAFLLVTAGVAAWRV